ncbi:MAG TPA: hypothetical protein ENF21_04295 [Bacteroidetes bacterium]|nr:hypothetical protein [Bacteroidota bacterium]
MQKRRTYEEINQKIKSGRAVVLTASEVSELSKTLPPAEIFRKVDVVTTATFAPMCSSGMFINVGHTRPPMRMEQVLLNDVPVYAGIAAVDAYIGATSESESRPGYGGAHLIEELIAGKEVEITCRAKGTDCYPLKSFNGKISRHTVNEMILFNPRNAYQNYAAAVNTSDRTLYTYMGVLLPRLGNLTYSTSGELSPLLNDPWLRTIGVGTRIFLGGGRGYVTGRGTQFRTDVERNAHGIPLKNAATLAVTGDAKEMDTAYIRAAYFEKYGVSLFVGIGIPVPVLDEDMAARVSIRNEQIETTITDYASPSHEELGRVNYRQLLSGYLHLKGKKVRTAPMSSLPVARRIAVVLAKEIRQGKFSLTQPVETLS